MAILNNSLVNGDLRVTGTIYGNNIAGGPFETLLKYNRGVLKTMANGTTWPESNSAGDDNGRIIGFNSTSYIQAASNQYGVRFGTTGFLTYNNSYILEKIDPAATGNYSQSHKFHGLCNWALSSASSNTSGQADKADQIKINDAPSSGFMYLVGRTGTTFNIYSDPYVSNGLKYNLGTNTLVATTFSGNLSGNAYSANHSSAYGYCYLWGDNTYDASKPYAKLAERTISTTAGWGFGDLFKLDVANTFIIFRLEYRGTTTATSATAVKILYTGGLTRTEVSSILKVRYKYTANNASGANVSIYCAYNQSIANFYPNYARITLRQLNGNTGAWYSKDVCVDWTFYQVTSSSGMSASLANTELPLEYDVSVMSTTVNRLDTSGVVGTDPNVMYFT